MSSQHALISLIARVLLAAIFISAGYGKIAGYDATLGYMAAKGIPGALLPAVIAVELLGGIAILLGLFSRLSALLLAGFCVLSGLLFHTSLPGMLNLAPMPEGATGFFPDQIQSIMFMKNLAIAGGLLLLYANGPGAWAVRD